MKNSYCHIILLLLFMLALRGSALAQGHSAIGPQDGCLKPAAPTALDVPSTACPNTAVRLSGRPSPGCYLEWRSAWGGTLPNQVEGDTVSIAFGDTVATLLVFQVDAETGCRSDSTVLQFSEFKLAPLCVDVLEFCRGQRASIGVSDQSADGVLYNWRVADPQLASIEVDNRTSAISIIGNYSGSRLPYRTMLYLNRKSCIGERRDAVELVIGDAPPLADSAGLGADTARRKADDVATPEANPIVPRLKIGYNCRDSLIITDSSTYRDRTKKKTITVSKEDGTIVYSATMPRDVRTVRVPSGGLAEGERLSVAFAAGQCRKVFHYTFHNGPRNVSITARSSMCNQTPFLFSGDAEGVGLVYKWTFGDWSYNYGQNIWHVFRENSHSFSVELIVIDSQGCLGSDGMSIQTINNPFETGGMRTYRLNYEIADYPSCDGSRVELAYNSGLGSSHRPTGTRYVWTPQGDTTFGFSSYADHSGTYLVFATDTTFQCRTADRVDLKFKSRPTARIGHKRLYGIGETVRLTGNTGAQYGYEWKVTSPSRTVYGYHTPNISFEADEAGTWTVDLTVTAPQGMGGCSASSSSTFEVAAQWRANAEEND